MNRRNNGWLCSISLVVVVVSLLVSACNADGTPKPTNIPVSTTTNVGPTSLPAETDTPTPAPIGSSENPITIALVSVETNSDVIDAGNQIAKFLTNQTGYQFQSSIFDTYPTLLAAIESGTVQVAWLPPFTYIFENQKGLVNVALMTNHYGVYSYGTMFLANVDNGFSSFFNPDTNHDTADAATALSQFNGKRPCLVEPSSASGYVVPLGILATENIAYQEPVVAQTFNAVIRALYIGQICDFGATYAISGDPRTASSIQDSFPDVMEKITIIWQTDAVIPNLGLVYRSDLPKGICQLITDALMNWAKTTEGKTALSAANQYDIEDLKVIDNSFYEPLRGFLKASALNVDDLVGR